MDDGAALSDAKTFAQSLYSWVGPHAVGYAEERAAAFRRAGDLAGSKAWIRVAKAARQFHESKVKREKERSPE